MRAVLVSMVTNLLRRWRIRRMLRAWARGELESSGAVGWHSRVQHH